MQKILSGYIMSKQLYLYGCSYHLSEPVNARGVTSHLTRFQSYEDKGHDLHKASKLPYPNHYTGMGQPVVALPLNAKPRLESVTSLCQRLGSFGAPQFIIQSRHKKTPQFHQ